MFQIHSLDKIIKQVDTNYQSQSIAEKVVIVDRKKKQILSKKPILGLGSNNLKFYLVRTNKSDNNFAICEKLKCRVSDFSSKSSLDVYIDYRARCRPENAEKLVLALCSEDSLAEELNRNILSWISEIINNRTLQLIENFPAEVKSLEQQLQIKANAEIGLTLEINIYPEDINALKQISINRIIQEGKLKSYSPNPFNFNVKVFNYTGELKLQLATVLEVSDDQKAANSYGNEHTFLALIKDEVNKYLLSEVSLHDFIYKLQTNISQNLKERLNSILTHKGRQVGYLSLTSESIPVVKSSLALKEFCEIKNSEVFCSIKGYDKTIKVINTLQLQLEDIGKYNAAFTGNQLPLDPEGKPSLEHWVRSKLETIVKRLLLEKTYVDILLDFEPTDSEFGDGDYKNSEIIGYSAEVLSQMKEAAKAIGYMVSHIISLPDLEPFKLKDNCTLDTGEREYATKNSNVKIKLKIVTIARIDNLRKIKLLLNPEILLQNQMVEKICNSASQYLNGIEPERFYMRFGSFDPAMDEKKSVEQELIELVRNELTNHFKATINNVIPQIVNTDITDLFEDLRAEKGYFTIEVNSLNINSQSSGEPIVFQGNFQVVRVEPTSWYQFQSKFQSYLGSRDMLLQQIEQLEQERSRIVANEDSEVEFKEISQRIKFIKCQSCGVNDIKEAIENNLKAKLETFDNSQLQYIRLESMQKIENIFQGVVNNSNDRGSILSEFGLNINIFSLSRSRSESEEKLSEQWHNNRLKEIENSSLHIKSRDRYIERIEKQLEKLYGRIEKIVDVEGSEGEIEELQNKINSIEKDILTPSLKDADDKLKNIEPPKVEPQTFDDMAQILNLSSKKNNPTINPNND